MYWATTKGKSNATKMTRKYLYLFLVCLFVCSMFARLGSPFNVPSSSIYIIDYVLLKQFRKSFEEKVVILKNIDITYYRSKKEFEAKFSFNCIQINKMTINRLSFVASWIMVLTMLNIRTQYYMGQAT